MFALSNLWMARKQLMGMGELCAEHSELGVKNAQTDITGRFSEIVENTAVFFNSPFDDGELIGAFLRPKIETVIELE